MMANISEELQLLGLWEKSSAAGKCEFASQFLSAVRGLLDLYHSTFMEKKDLEESLRRHAVEMRDLKDCNHKLRNEGAKQAALIARLKNKEDNLLAKIETSTVQCNQLKKKGMEERLKWQRSSNMDKIALKKAHQEISSLKDVLRKIYYRSSMKGKENEEFVVVRENIHIIKNHLGIEIDREKKKSSKEEILRKTIRQLDASQRQLVEESTSLASSLKVIHSRVLQAINALKVYFVQEGHLALLDSLKCEDEAVNDQEETPSWLPLLVSCIHEKSAELDVLTEALLKNSPSTAGGVAEGVVRKYLTSFCEYENVLDVAVQSICLK
ncbi:uncharacterized protein LOC124157551 isoform X2 [Ischnura elegans]|uniref:uncharacterized protein LOC124157551 isoform X2 n=1 Tax=Ischnura elegans TaxID=197161 RepID=UPI001ED875E3|nr:uncharacterized protein LOC124157551 isoform X2 [Ischnura elegans]